MRLRSFVCVLCVCYMCHAVSSVLGLPLKQIYIVLTIDLLFDIVYAAVLNSFHFKYFYMNNK